tara:strand:+ start:1708 stop:1857 length:150 start_codon:yes stop_codon:yes gene_type:complete
MGINDLDFHSHVDRIRQVANLPVVQEASEQEEARGASRIESDGMILLIL